MWGGVAWREGNGIAGGWGRLGRGGREVLDWGWRGGRVLVGLDIGR